MSLPLDVPSAEEAPAERRRVSRLPITPTGPGRREERVSWHLHRAVASKLRGREGKELEHAIRAATHVLNDDGASTLAPLLDGAIGELSAFHDTHGFSVQGVDQRTATLPRSWDLRLVEVRSENTSGRAGYCLDPYDLCAAKLTANRPKDLEYVGALIEASLIDPRVLATRRTVDVSRWFGASPAVDAAGTAGTSVPDDHRHVAPAAEHVHAQHAPDEARA